MFSSFYPTQQDTQNIDESGSIITSNSATYSCAESAIIRTCSSLGVNTVTYFGIGSILNIETISSPIVEYKPSFINGWRRGWVQPFPEHLGPYVGLGLVPGDPASRTHGATIHLPESDVAEIAQREYLYSSIFVEAEDRYGTIDLATAFQTTDHLPSNATIPMSYLATVAEGFLFAFGPRGFDILIENSFGWELGIVDDLDSPIYPRVSKKAERIATMLYPHLAHFMLSSFDSTK